MERLSRRQILAMTAIAMTASVTGCTSSTVTDTVDGAVEELQNNLDKTSTEDLQQYKLALRGYAIVSMTIAGRIVFLPYPGMRILTVMIVASAVSAKLVVQYIDDELIHRKLEEVLADRERSAIERDGYIEFQAESGFTQQQYLAPTQYAEFAENETDAPSGSEE